MTELRLCASNSELFIQQFMTKITISVNNLAGVRAKTKFYLNREFKVRNETIIKCERKILLYVNNSIVSHIIHFKCVNSSHRQFYRLLLHILKKLYFVLYCDLIKFSFVSVGFFRRHLYVRKVFTIWRRQNGNILLFNIINKWVLILHKIHFNTQI